MAFLNPPEFTLANIGPLNKADLPPQFKLNGFIPCLRVHEFTKRRYAPTS